jgi:hypothetical protein
MRESKILVDWHQASSPKLLRAVQGAHLSGLLRSESSPPGYDFLLIGHLASLPKLLGKVGSERPLASESKLLGLLNTPPETIEPLVSSGIPLQRPYYGRHSAHQNHAFHESWAAPERHFVTLTTL